MTRNRDPWRRQDVLAAGIAGATAGLAGCTAAPTRSVETVVSVPGERVPENLAFGPEGALYVGITAGELRRLPAARVGETGLALADTDELAVLPGAVGVETAPDGTAYVCVATDDERGGVWEVPPSGGPRQLVQVDGFPNDLLFDPDGDRLLVTESFGGVVYDVGTDGSRRVWLDDDRLSTERFGANGIAREGSDLYVSVTRAAGETGRVVRVPFESDGRAGAAETLVAGESVFGADGITAREGAVYVAANSQNRVVRVGSGGDTEVLLTGADGLVFPSDVLFGPDGALYVCNFANDSPADGAVLRARL